MGELAISPLGAVLATLFVVALGGLLLWMFRVPPPLPYEVARITQAFSSIRRIVVPVVDTEYSQRGIELAARLGAEQQAELVLVYVLEVPMTLPLGAALPATEDRAAEALREAGEIATFHHQPYRARTVRARSAGAGILQAVEDEQADLVVLSIRSRLAGYNPLGRTADWLVRHSPMEVVIDKLPD
ncbi:MAG: universal stress protein [Clostridia bacterium]|nr:MAG: universal stress protein [Clostridia bacterium]